MTPLDIIIYTIGFFTLMWFLFGFVLFTFFTKVYVSAGAPLLSKVITVLVSSFVMPYLLFTVGALPVALITPKITSPEEDERIRNFLANAAKCDCPKCRARRGE